MGGTSDWLNTKRTSLNNSSLISDTIKKKKLDDGKCPRVVARTQILRVARQMGMISFVKTGCKFEQCKQIQTKNS